MPVKTEPTAGDGGVLAVTLMKASSCNYCRPTRAASGEPYNLVFRIERWRHGGVVSLLGASFVEQRWKSEAGGRAASSCTEFRWRCQVMPDRQVLRFVMPGRQVLRTTDLPRLKLCRLVVLGSMVLRCISGDRDMLSCLRAGRRCLWAPWWHRR